MVQHRVLEDTSASLNNLGMGLAELGKDEEAIACFERAVRLRPDHAEAHARLGQILARPGRREEANRHLAEAVRLQPGNEEFRELLRIGMAP